MASLARPLCSLATSLVSVCLLLCLSPSVGFLQSSVPIGLRVKTDACSLSAQVNRIGRPAAPANLQMQFGLGNMFKGKEETAEEAGLVPDVWPEPFETKSVLRVKYPAWVKSAVDLTNVASFGGTPTRGAGEIKTGQVVTPTQAQEKPVLGWEAEEGSYYTVILTDPDAPSRAEPKLREYVHWARVNILGENLPCDGQDGGDDLKEYVGAGPPSNTGDHRYFFLVFKQQDGKTDFDDDERIPFVNSGRPNFKTADFAAKYNLGAPIAWSYFKASYDNYVLELYAKLKGDDKN